MQPKRSTYNQGPCKFCGEIGAAHEKVRVVPDGGPSGTFHYEYHCPDGSGRRYQQ